MPQPINLKYLQQLLFPLGYKLDDTQEFPVFWKQITQNDLRSKYAFSVVMATLHSHSFRIEGMNEPKFIRAVKAGQITLEKPEDIENHREVLFEAMIDDTGRLEPVLTFLEQQLAVVGSMPIHAPEYKEDLQNIEMIVKAANQIDMED